MPPLASNATRWLVVGVLALLVLVVGTTASAAGASDDQESGWKEMEATGDRLIGREASVATQRFWNAAEQMYLGALEIAEGEQASEEDRAELLLKLGRVSHRFGRYDEAAGRLERALVLAEAAYGSEAPALCAFLEELGTVAYLQEDLDSGRAAYERCLSIRERAFGARSLEVAEMLQLLGAAYVTEGELERGLALHREALGIWRELLPPDHELIYGARANVIQTLILLGRQEEAEELRRTLRSDSDAPRRPRARH